MLGQIKKDNENDMDQVRFVNEEPEVTNLPFERKKEMESKVIYQYPKGKFRFPVIPDSESSEKLKREEGNRKRKRKEENIVPVVLQKEEKQQVISSSQTTETTTENKVEIPKMKKPFRLTETISPIYGYNRPLNNHENNKKAFNLEEYEQRHDGHLSSSIEKENEKLLLFEEYLEGNKQQEEATVNEVEVNKEVLTAEMNQMSLFKEAEDKNLNGFQTQQLAVAENVIDETKDQSVVQFKEENNIQEFDLKTEMIEENEEGEKKEAGFEHSVSSSSNLTEDAPIAIEEKKHGKAAKRSSLPFNVLMLNKDRRYIEQKRKEQEALALEKKRAEQKKLQEEKVALEEKRAEQTRLEQLKAMQAEKDRISSIQKQEGILGEEEERLAYYAFPSVDLLHPPVKKVENDDWIKEQTNVLNNTLLNFNVQAKVVNVTQGPSVTRYEVQPEPGVKVSKITNLSDDLKLSLAAKDIRIEAPIPGKHTIGIEVPNRTSRPVLIKEIINSDVFKQSESPLTVALGLDISGKPIVTDLRKMPHGLIAGATGSGKSVCINTMLVSLLYKAKPEELKLLLIDPKMVELAPYNFIPHLASPVITDVKTATAALKWAVEEMENRYELLAHAGVRDITKYNQLAIDNKNYSQKLPYIVIIIDELADLMMMAPADVEEAISRIAQKARACGIHLLIATQRPSVDVITGLIKANVPTRIAFSVSSQIDSRTVIDISGAEKLLGKGDMLFLENGTSKPARLQGTFVSDEEIDVVVQHVRREREPDYLFEQEELLRKVQITEEEDELFFEACEFIIEQGGASTSSLQRRFKIGYNRAARLIDMMEKQGFISEAKGTKPRDVLITEDEFLQLQDQV
ncbi:DNA translocase FtsK [Niallia nealsonii]|uniref:DNA translocase FtsK n=2 Tax=Niallia nealsonii TaxID=115979 RepID=A0A2N0Z6E8_9BACI|nr:DNA translocase FtsK [Niallia nealsonii]